MSQVSESANSTTVSRFLPSPPSPAKGCNLHVALKGNPGTGKTSVASLIGEIYREAGLLEMGHFVKVTEKDLVAGYIQDYPAVLMRIIQ